MGKSKKLRIGLLGGTFNPAHKGHKTISIEAIKRLKLDSVIWLVTPQNLLKNLDVTNNYQERFEYAKKIANHPKIEVSDIEAKIKSNYTYKTLSILKQMHPEVEFVWLMGADNLANFHKWKCWRKIIEQCSIAIFDRDDFAKLILYSPLTLEYDGGIEKTYIKALVPNRWHYFNIKKVPISSTEIRNKKGNIFDDK